MAATGVSLWRVWPISRGCLYSTHPLPFSVARGDRGDRDDRCVPQRPGLRTLLAAKPLPRGMRSVAKLTLAAPATMEAALVPCVRLVFDGRGM